MVLAKNPPWTAEKWGGPQHSPTRKQPGRLPFSAKSCVSEVLLLVSLNKRKGLMKEKIMRSSTDYCNVNILTQQRNLLCQQENFIAVQHQKKKPPPKAYIPLNVSY